LPLFLNQMISLLLRFHLLVDEMMLLHRVEPLICELDVFTLLLSLVHSESSLSLLLDQLGEKPFVNCIHNVHEEASAVRFPLPKGVFQVEMHLRIFANHFDNVADRQLGV